jgi:hypothetical protein
MRSKTTFYPYLLLAFVVFGWFGAGSAAAGEEDFKIEVLRGTHRTVEGPNTRHDPHAGKAKADAANQPYPEAPRESPRVTVYVGNSGYEDDEPYYYGGYGSGFPIVVPRGGRMGFNGQRDHFRGHRGIHHRAQSHRSADSTGASGGRQVLGMPRGRSGR